jgi:uncharacterized Tic20 family protein
METNENQQNAKEFWGMDELNYCMLMHLSQFAGYIIPFGGLVMPLVMWLTNNKQSETVDEHGKNIVNWIISMVIYAIISSILIVIFVGIGMLVILGILAIVFPIIGAVKANKGEIWKYPLAITFIK